MPNTEPALRKQPNGPPGTSRRHAMDAPHPLRRHNDFPIARMIAELRRDAADRTEDIGEHDSNGEA